MEFAGSHEDSVVTFRVRRADGEIRWVEHRCVSVRGNDGEHLGSRGSKIDISDRVRYETVLRRSVRKKEGMLRKIDHRIKNNLQLIGSLISLRRDASHAEETGLSLDAIAGRVGAVSGVHTTSYQVAEFGVVDMDEYLSMLVSYLRPLQPGVPAFATEVATDGIISPLSTAIPCGLVVNEAITNVARHGL